MKLPDTKKVSLLLLCALFAYVAKAQTVTNNNATITIQSGTNVIINGNVVNSATITNGGNLSLTGNWTNNGTGNAGSGTVEFNGTSGQSIAGSTATTFGTLRVNNSSDVTLSQNATANTSLTFTNGKINTGANKVSIASGGTVTGAGAGKYVNGNLEKFIAAATASKNFEIGDGANYTPALVAFTGTTNGTGSLTASTTPGAHPQLATSGIGGKRANRYWTITNNGNSVTGFSSYDATLNYVAGDLIGGANPLSFVVRKYDGAWTAPTTGTVTATSTQGTTMSSFSDFIVGEGETISVNSHPSNATICAASNTSFTSTSLSVPTPNVQWQVDNGGGFTDISNVGVYTGATTSTLNITGATLSMNGYVYRARFSNINGTVFSNPATLTVHEEISNLTAGSPTNPICEGSTLDLTASVTAGTGITYSWSGPGSFTSSAQNPSRANIQEVNSPVGQGVYTVTATNACATTASASVNINVHRPMTSLNTPSFNQNPICEGQNLTISVTYNNPSDVTAGDITWSWNGPNGFTSNNQNPTINGITQAAAGDYVVVASTECGATNQFSPTLTVTPPPTTSDAGADQSLCGGNTTTLAGNTPTAGTGTWSVLIGTGGSFNNVNDPSSGFTGNLGTTYTLQWSISNAPCTPASTSTVIIAFNNIPSVSASNTGPYAGGQTIQLNATPNGYTSYSWSGPNGFSSNLQNPTKANADALDNGTFTVTVTDANNCTNSASTNVSVNTGVKVWLGYDNDWHTATNWSPAGVPNSCAVDVLIPTAPIGGERPIVSTGVSVGNIIVSDNVRMTLNANLNVCGNWTGGSTTQSVIDGAQTVVFTSSAVADQELAGKTRFTKLRVNNTGGGAQLQAGAIMEIVERLELQNGDLNTNGALLHFLSNSSTQIATIDNFSSGFSGTLTGNITADRAYDATAPNSFNQHYMGSPVDAPSVTQFGASGTPGYVQKSPSGCYADLPAPGSPYGTFFEYDETKGGINNCAMEQWKVVTSGPATNGKGYSVARKGAGTLSLTGEANLDADYLVSGLQNTGWSNTVTYINTYPYTSRPATSGWHLISNPYLAYFDIQQHGANSEFDNQIQVWNATGPLEASYQPLMSGVDALVAPFQAFMIHKTSTVTPPATYTLYASDRTLNQTAFYRKANDHSLKIFAEDMSTGKQDVTTISYNTDATSTFDPVYDANKLAGGVNRQTLYTLNPVGARMAINTNNNINETPNVPLSMQPGGVGTYKFTVDGINSFDPTTYIYLEDKVTGQWTDLRQHAQYIFTMAPSDDVDRFVVHFTPPVQVATTDGDCGNQAQIEIVQPGDATWKYVLAEVTTQTPVASGSLTQGSPVHASVAPGTYKLMLTDNSNYSVSKMIQVSGAQGINTSFTTSVATPAVNQDVTFNTNVANGTQYEWEFSDGTIITGVANPVYSFNQPGTYTVTLTATNSDGCSSSTTQTITVTGGTGIADIASNSIKIWGEGNTVRVDLRSIKNPKATIDFYNALGQVIHSEQGVTFGLYTKTFDISSGYLMVKVRNTDGMTLVKKVFVNNN